MQGRVAKTVNQRALLEQAYIKDSSKTVGEIVKESIAGIGENIKIRRFERCAASDLPAMNAVPGAGCAEALTMLRCAFAESARMHMVLHMSWCACGVCKRH